MFKIVYWLARIVLFPIYRYRFEGRENLPDGPCLICGNHTANIDSVLVIMGLESRGNYAIISKAELFKNPLLGGIMRFVRAFPVRRGDGDVGAIKAALRALKDGKRLIVFPEGTRVKTGESGGAKAGAGMFAIRGNVPVVPVYVPEGKKAWKRNTVRFGAPITPPDFDGRRPTPEDYAECSNRIMDSILAMRPTQIWEGWEEV